MTVTSREIHQEEPKPAQPVPVATPPTEDPWPVGLALLAFGLPGWLAGGKYTLVGWVTWGNWILSWLGVPARIPIPSGWWVLLLFPVAYIYSEVEVRHRPFRQRKARRVPPLGWAAWLLVVATDVATTYTGVRIVAPDAFPIMQQVAAQPLLAGAWAVILTFLPEWLILGGLAYLWGRRS